MGISVGLMTSHVRRYHRHWGTSGHVWQARFNAFPIEDDESYYTVLRYVERNTLRANPVERAELWPWTSLKLQRDKQPPDRIVPGPLQLSRDWRQTVNRPLTHAELDAVRNSVNRGAPFGSATWAEATATEHGLESSLRACGWPRLKK
ncbi:MAG: transposase [Planctomycetaceae bacterium]